MAQPAGPLEDVIAESLAEWAEPFVELAVFGTADPAAIVGTVERFCAAHLGADPVACLFWSTSVGIAIGVVLDDEREVVIKAHQPGVDRSHLAAVVTLRDRLAADGFPTPRMLSGPHTFARGAATIEAYVDAAPPVDGLRPQHREALARGLCQMVARATARADGLTLAEYPLAPPSAALWPAPHSRLFDFARTAEGAETIDEIAQIARDRRVDDLGDRVVAHLDWRVEHVRFLGTQIAAVFDWDNVHRVAESEAVGVAAAHFAANWLPGFTGRRYPTPEESDAFVAAYASERGRPFSDEARRAIGAARTYAIAYAARCGHDPALAPMSGAAEELLLRFGERFLVVRG